MSNIKIKIHVCLCAWKYVLLMCALSKFSLKSPDDNFLHSLVRLRNKVNSGALCHDLDLTLSGFPDFLNKCNSNSISTCLIDLMTFILFHILIKSLYSMFANISEEPLPLQLFSPLPQRCRMPSAMGHSFFLYFLFLNCKNKTNKTIKLFKMQRLKAEYT